MSISASETREESTASGARSAATGRWLLAAFYACLTATALYPVFSVTVPPLVDYPNHLARAHILTHRDEIAALQQNYIVHWMLHPNMAMDLIVPPLARFMSIYMAGKLFVAATLLSVIGGTLMLRKVLHGQVGLWPSLAFLLLYNHALFWGFLNYLFAAGLALMAFAAWIALRGRAWRSRVAVFSAFALVLYVCHLFGLMIYGLLVLGYEIWRTGTVGWRGAMHRADWLVAGAQFVVPGVLFLAWIAGNASPDQAKTDFGTLADRAVILLTPVHFDMPWLDIPTLAFFGAVWILARSGRGATIAPALKIPLILLTACALVMPVYLSGVWGTHIRLPVVIGCLLIAGTQLPQGGWRPVQVVAAAAVALFALRTGVIAEQWRNIDGKFAEFRAASVAIEPGASVITVQDDGDLPEGRSPLYGMQFWHMNALAVIERSAFVPTLLTGFTSIDGSEAVKHIETPVGNPVSHQLLAMGADASRSPYPLGYHLERYMWLYFIGWPEHFDYMLSIRFDNAAPLYPKRVRPVAAGSFFDIGRVR